MLIKSLWGNTGLQDKYKENVTIFQKVIDVWVYIVFHNAVAPVRDRHSFKVQMRKGSLLGSCLLKCRLEEEEQKGKGKKSSDQGH